MLPTQPTGQPETTETQARTKPCHIGRSYEYLCQTGNAEHPIFTYSHQPFGRVVWHRG